MHFTLRLPLSKVNNIIYWIIQTVIRNIVMLILRKITIVTIVHTYNAFRITYR